MEDEPLSPRARRLAQEKRKKMQDDAAANIAGRKRNRKALSGGAVGIDLLPVFVASMGIGTWLDNRAKAAGEPTGHVLWGFGFFLLYFAVRIGVIIKQAPKGGPVADTDLTPNLTHSGSAQESTKPVPSGKDPLSAMAQKND